MTAQDSLAAHLAADSQAEARGAERVPRSAVGELAGTKSAQTPLDAADSADLGASLPDNAALLVVSRSLRPGRSSFRAQFHFGQQTESSPDDDSADELLAELQTIPAASTLAAEAAEADDPTPWRQAYFNTVGMWIAYPALIRWIHRVFTSGVADPCLIVRDNTTFGIPWELFYKQAVYSGPNPSEQSGWLGSLIRVVRWVTLSDGGVSCRNEATAAAWQAGMLMLEDTGLHQDGDKFDDYLVEHPRTPNMYELLGWLAHREGPFGMVLIRCHGVFSDDPRKLTLCDIPYNEYEPRNYQMLARNAPLVFLNVCAGARASGGQAGHPFSFSELFLRKGASGVIAATADIDVDHSHEFAKDLLADACVSAANVAEWIRKRRAGYAAYAERLASEQPPMDPEQRKKYDKEHERDFKRFFEAFKLVYFGHPESTLHALRNGSGGQARP
jgi:hypothetical protein